MSLHRGRAANPAGVNTRSGTACDDCPRPGWLNVSTDVACDVSPIDGVRTGYQDLSRAPLATCRERSLTPMGIGDIDPRHMHRPGQLTHPPQTAAALSRPVRCGRRHVVAHLSMPSRSKKTSRRSTCPVRPKTAALVAASR